MGERIRVLSAVMVLALGGCGYHLAGTGVTVPPTAHSIRIEPFANHTREIGLEVRLHRALEDEFRRRGDLRVVVDGDADLILSGDVRRFVTAPVTFSATDEAVQYQATVQVGVRLTERETGRVLHETKAIQESQDFGAVSGVVISSSPHFQRGTMNASDLTDLTNIQIGQARRHEALRDLLDVIARDVYLLTMEGF